MAFRYSPKIVTDGLVLYLDAANTKSYVSGSTTWNDISRTGANGTLTNGPTFNSSNGGSIVFDGSNDFVNCGASDAYNPVNSITVGCWVYFNSLNRREIFIGKGNGVNATTNQYWIEKQLDNTFLLLISTLTPSPFETRLILSNFTIQNNQWYNICLTYDRQTFKGYINGIQHPSTTSVTNALHTTSFNLGVGRLGDLGGIYLSGRVSNACLYNRALTAQEVLQNYNSTKSRFGLA